LEIKKKDQDFRGFSGRKIKNFKFAFISETKFQSRQSPAPANFAEQTVANVYYTVKSTP
jgi:hypothetical protein